MFNPQLERVKLEEFKSTHNLTSNSNEYHKYLGRIIIKYLVEEELLYKKIDSKDIFYLEENSLCIWNNMDKKLLEEFLLDFEEYPNREYEDWEDIMNKIDSVLINDLKYFYHFNDDEWNKKYVLGDMIWNIAMKNSNVFNNVRNISFKEDEYNSYMEFIVENMRDKSSYFLNDTYNFLKYIAEQNIDYSNYLKEYEKRNEFGKIVQDDMINATSKLFEQHLSHLVKWDENESAWILLEA